MGITRTVSTIVSCDKCGKTLLYWRSDKGGVSKKWAAYFAKTEGAEIGTKGVTCKTCRIAEKRKRCSLIKKLGEPGKEADGTCKGIMYVGEPMEPRCKKCVSYTGFNWKEEKEKIRI